MTTEIDEFLRKNPSRRKVSGYRQHSREIAELVDRGVSLQGIVNFLVAVRKIDANQSALWAFLDRELRRHERGSAKLNVSSRFAASLSRVQKGNPNILDAPGPPPSHGQDLDSKNITTTVPRHIDSQPPHAQVAITSDDVEKEAKRICPEFDQLQMDVQAEILAQIRVSASKISRNSNNAQNYKDILTALNNSKP